MSNSTQYAYDDLYRLTSESRTGSHPYQTAFTYDNVGNPTFPQKVSHLQ